MSRTYLSQRVPPVYSRQVFADLMAEQDRENARLTTSAGTGTWNPPSIVDGDSASTTISVSGAKVNSLSSVRVFAPYSLQGMQADGYVSADNTVTIVLTNNSGGTVDLASGTWGVVVESFVQT